MSIDDSRTGRREFLTSATAAAVAFGLGPFGPSAKAIAHRGTILDDPALHGMLLFGDKKVYLSHLPMFSRAVHRYQVLLEATFTKAGADPQAAYVKDRHAHPDISIYTFVPDPFVLPELDPKDQKRKSFTGRTVRGHFERKGNAPIDEGVTAMVSRVIHFQAFAQDPAPLSTTPVPLVRRTGRCVRGARDYEAARLRSCAGGEAGRSQVLGRGAGSRRSAHVPRARQHGGAAAGRRPGHRRGGRARTRPGQGSDSAPFRDLFRGE